MPLVQQGKAFNGQILCEEIWQCFNSLLNCFPPIMQVTDAITAFCIPKYFTEVVTQVLIQNISDYKRLFHKIMLPLY